MSRPRLRPSRRTFLGGTAAAAASAGVLAHLPAAQASSTGRSRPGRLDDVEHVVILMQENRSVDHYYGTMRGVRGYGDKTALRWADGRTVFHQADVKRTDGGFLLPYHVDTTEVDGQDLGGNDHSWGGVHTQWADGANSGFVTDTGEITMGYFTEHDVPFNRALASAFTFCDHYFCSIKGPTTPNRLYHWSGTVDPDGRQGGPANYNPDDYEPVFSWTTYPERLQAAGVSWRVYANDEVGDGGGEDGYVGDYGDNPLWLFRQYHDALASTDPRKRVLAERASVRAQWKPNSGKGHDVDWVLKEFLADVRAKRLPSVSWVVAPYRYSEHPQARPVDGAAYQQTVLNAIWADPELWSKTVVLVNYDEHDGFFDHVISPTAPQGTPEEFIQGLPIGLGPRVPMTVVSPWSRGGFISSEVFDHTSVLQFLERWTGVRETNISVWRRELCGDLLGAFDFTRSTRTIPSLPDTAALRAAADATQSRLPTPAPPAPGQQRLPIPEHGSAPARALPYQPTAHVAVDGAAVAVAMSNRGERALQFGVYDLLAPATPAQRIDVAGHAAGRATVAATDVYAVAVHAPNGFLHEARGTVVGEVLDVTTSVTGSPGRPTLRLTFANRGRQVVVVRVSGLGRGTRTIPIAPGTHSVVHDPCEEHGWYDVSVVIERRAGYLRRFTGHLENGRPSVTG